MMIGMDIGRMDFREKGSGMIMKTTGRNSTINKNDKLPMLNVTN